MVHKYHGYYSHTHIFRINNQKPLYLLLVWLSFFLRNIGYNYDLLINTQLPCLFITCLKQSNTLFASRMCKHLQLHANCIFYSGYNYVAHCSVFSLFISNFTLFVQLWLWLLLVGYKASSETPYASHTLVQIIQHFIPKLSTQSILLKP